MVVWLHWQGCSSGDVTGLCVVQRNFAVGQGAQQGEAQLKASWATWWREVGDLMPPEGQVDS